MTEADIENVVSRLNRDGFAIIGEGVIPSRCERDPILKALARACLEPDSHRGWSSRQLNDAEWPTTDWHRDMPGNRSALSQGDPASLSFIYAEVDFRKDNGATQVLPGSHRATSSNARRERSRTERAITLEMPRYCTAVLINSHVLHRAGHNRSGVLRPASLVFVAGRWRGYR